MSPVSPAMADGFFTTDPPGKPKSLVQRDSFSSYKSLWKSFFFPPLVPSFLCTKCSSWEFILVSYGAPQGPEAPDFRFLRAAELHPFTSADASHLPGILPNPILAWCPLRERNPCPLSLQCTRPWAECCTHFSSFDPTHNPVRKISLETKANQWGNSGNLREEWTSRLWAGLVSPSTARTRNPNLARTHILSFPL